MKKLLIVFVAFVFATSLAFSGVVLAADESQPAPDKEEMKMDSPKAEPSKSKPKMTKEAKPTKKKTGKTASAPKKKRTKVAKVKKKIQKEPAKTN